jgi:hypothetical protein
VRQLSVTLIAMSCLAVSPKASAADHRPKLMLLDLPSDPAFPPNSIKILNSFLAKDFRDQGFQVITTSDIETVLGVERQKQLMGCGESSCFAELGGAIGADYIVHGELGSVSHDTAVTLTLNDNRGQSVNQIADVVKSQDVEAILDTLGRSVTRLVQPLRDSGKLGKTSVPAAVTTATSSDSGAASHVGSYVLLGIGAAALIGSAATGLLANSGNSTLKNEADGTSPVSSSSAGSGLRSTVTTEAWISTGLLGVGVVAAGMGAVWLLTGSSAPATVAIAPGGHPALAWAF